MAVMRTTLVLFAAAAVLAGCGTDPIDPPPPPMQWTGTLVGAAGWEQLLGEGAFLWAEGAPGITAGALLTGDEAGAIRPWHVHHNTCAEGGDIVGPAGAYPPLVIGADGAAEVVTDVVPASIDPEASFHMNVHLSADELETIIACGDLFVTVSPASASR